MANEMLKPGRLGHRKKGRRSDRSDGFTMMELLVTMVLMTVVLVGLAALQVHTIRQVTSSKRANEATRLCQMQIERYQTMSYAAVQALVVTDWTIPDNVQGNPMQNVAVDGVSSGPYTVQYIIEELTANERALITVRVSWLDVSTGNETDPTQRYRTLNVVMSTQKSL